MTLRPLALTCLTAALTATSFGLPQPQPEINLSPTSLTFAPQVVGLAGTTSLPQTVTVTNPGSVGLAINNIGSSGFYSQTNNCPVAGVLAAKASCVINVTFAPNELGQFNGGITITDDAVGTPHVVALSGTAIAPVAFSPSSLDFGNIAVGASSTKVVTLDNNQTNGLTISGIFASGDYSQTSTCPTSLGAGQSCTIYVTFRPTVAGPIPGTVAVSTDAFPGTQPLGLSGSGSGSVTSQVVFLPAALDFGTQEAGTASAAKTVAVTNSSASNTLSITSVNSSGPAYQLSTDTCSGNTLQPGATCTISLIFQPVADFVLVDYPGAVTVTDSESTSPQVVGLSGTGVSPVTASPASLNFGTIIKGSSSALTAVNLSNHHNATENLSISISGDYAVSAINNTCTGPVPAAGKCSFQLTFNPRSMGTSSGAATIVASSGGFLNPQVVSLSGCQSDRSLLPPSLNFGVQAVGTSSQLQTATLANANTNVLNITGTSITGTNAGDFAVSNNTCGSSLSAGLSCTMNLIFTPTANGTRTATLNVSDDDSCSPQQLSLIGAANSGPPVPFLLKITTSGNGSGTVTSNPSGINCGSTCTASFDSGTAVTLTAAASGSTFVGWSGACTGTATCTVTMNADRSVIADFVAPDFSISGSAPNPVSPGQNSTSTVTVNSVNGFTGSVPLSCSVQPAVSLAPTCLLNPTSVIPAVNGTATSNLTISTTGPTASLASPSNRGLFSALWLPLLGLVLLGIGAVSEGSRKRRLMGLLLVTPLLAGLMLQNACGGGGTSHNSSGTPKGIYTITVTATSAVPHSTQVTLTVQ
jgi:ASPM-SPD-2-Hydin domain-containing protein/HYDIN/CFA65/VesB family protein/List-Bact-rpt repeat protein